MVLKEITYFIKGEKRKLMVKQVSILSTGLMFRRKSPPLLFVIPKKMNATITSFFCKPFTAIWLDDKMRSTKVTDVKTWKLNISGRGKYILEIPRTT